MMRAIGVHGFLEPGEPVPAPSAGVPGRRAVLNFLLPGMLLAAAMLNWHPRAALPAALPRPGARRYPAAYRHRP